MKYMNRISMHLNVTYNNEFGTNFAFSIMDFACEEIRLTDMKQTNMRTL